MAEFVNSDISHDMTVVSKDKDVNSKDVSNQCSDESSDGDKVKFDLECAVCLQKCIHPVKLPCSHIFCFLCAKGVATQSKRCAMCRQDIPSDFMDRPNLLTSLEVEKTESSAGYQWFYEGRNGWWQYDERTSSDLESAYTSGQRVCEVLVAGYVYVIDFDRMVQMRRNDPSRQRHIKRDLASIPKKGVAGIKLPSQLHIESQVAPQPTSDPLDSISSSIHSLTISSSNVIELCPPSPIAPSNTPQTPHTPSAASSNSGSPDTSDHMHLLHYQNVRPPPVSAGCQACLNGDSPVAGGSFHRYSRLQHSPVLPSPVGGRVRSRSLSTLSSSAPRTIPEHPRSADSPPLADSPGCVAVEGSPVFYSLDNSNESEHYDFSDNEQE